MVYWLFVSYFHSFFFSFAWIFRFFPDISCNLEGSDFHLTRLCLDLNTCCFNFKYQFCKWHHFYRHGLLIFFLFCFIFIRFLPDISSNLRGSDARFTCLFIAKINKQMDRYGRKLTIIYLEVKDGNATSKGSCYFL